MRKLLEKTSGLKISYLKVSIALGTLSVGGKTTGCLERL